MGERLVLDSSVAAKWYLKDELHAEMADALLSAFLSGHVELYAPCIIKYELAGALAKACLTRHPDTQRVRLQLGIADQSLRHFFRLIEKGIHIGESSAEEAVDSLRLSVAYSRKTYDMTFLRLACQLDCKWCTADEKVLQAAAPQFPADRILLLRDWERP